MCEYLYAILKLLFPFKLNGIGRFPSDYEANGILFGLYSKGTPNTSKFLSSWKKSPIYFSEYIYYIIISESVWRHYIACLHLFNFYSKVFNLAVVVEWSEAMAFISKIEYPTNGVSCHFVLFISRLAKILQY